MKDAKTVAFGNHNALRAAVGVVIFCFFLAGVIASMNDTLNPFLKKIYHLGFAEAALIQLSYYGANLFFAIPIGWMLGKAGFGRVMRGGMWIMGVSCLVMALGAWLNLWPVFLFAVMVMALGASSMTISGNPYMAVLGSEKYAAARLNLVNSFYTVGATLGPLLGAQFILGSPLSGSAPLLGFYLAGGLGILLITGLALFIPLPEPAPVSEQEVAFSPWKNKRFLFGWVAWFLYVGAEVVVPANVVNLLSMESMGGFTQEASGKWISLYWASMMTGRLIGIPVLNRVRPGQLLQVATVSAMGVALLLLLGPVAWVKWVILCVGLCHSTMFACIFLLATKGLGKQTGPATGWLFMAGTGGGVLTLLQGWLADQVALRVSLGILFISYLYILLFSKIFGDSKNKPLPPHEI